jgi:hypothetical protein
MTGQPHCRASMLGSWIDYVPRNSGIRRFPERGAMYARSKSWDTHAPRRRRTAGKQTPGARGNEGRIGPDRRCRAKRETNSPSEQSEPSERAKRVNPHTLNFPTARSNARSVTRSGANRPSRSVTAPDGARQLHQFGGHVREQLNEPAMFGYDGACQHSKTNCMKKSRCSIPAAPQRA